MSFPKEFRPIDADAVAASIEQRQRQQRSSQTAEGVPVTLEEQIRRSAPRYARIQGLAADVIARRADFDAAVASGDVNLALGCYFSWTDAMHRSTSQGGDTYRDIPPFSVAFDQATNRAVRARREG